MLAVLAYRVPGLASKPAPALTRGLPSAMLCARPAWLPRSSVVDDMTLAFPSWPWTPERGCSRRPPGTAWTLGTVATILANPRYTGRQVWNQQRTDSELADPANTSLGHKGVQRWNLPDGWVISARIAYPALVSEAGFITVQDINAARGPAPRADPAAPPKRQYLLAGLLTCGICGRRMESAWSNGKAAHPGWQIDAHPLWLGLWTAEHRSDDGRSVHYVVCHTGAALAERLASIER